MSSERKTSVPVATNFMFNRPVPNGTLARLFLTVAKMFSFNCDSIVCPVCATFIDDKNSLEFDGHSCHIEDEMIVESDSQDFTSLILSDPTPTIICKHCKHNLAGLLVVEVVEEN